MSKFGLVHTIIKFILQSHFIILLHFYSVFRYNTFNYMDLLYIRHPDARTHQNQLAFLETLAEPERSEHAQLFRFGNAAMHYYNKEKATATEEDYLDWLEGLKEPMLSDMKIRGFEGCKTMIPLLRHALERRDIGINQFVKGLLNQEDFAAWEQSGEN